ncbi:MAG: ABC transporter ATP-binding protein [Zestosphaera sp.]
MVDVELRDVWFQYPNSSEWVLKGVSLQVESGRFVVITGHNGSGKTTLLKIVATMYRPTKGDIVVDGVSVWRLSDEERTLLRRRVTYVHERPIMLRGSVLYNVMYGLSLRGMASDEAFKAAREVLEELGIWEHRSVNARKLSAGQAQLVALARALALNPEALVLDEPLAHLDSVKRETLMNSLVRRLKSNTTVIMSSHQVNYLRRFNTARVITLEGGTFTATDY